MREIIGKRIDIDGSPILFDAPIAEATFAEQWTVYGGQWRADGEWLVGRNPDNKPGMVFLDGDFPGNVLVEFEAQTVLPSSHDIDFMWNGSWDAEKGERGVAYVGGIEGWWGGKVGIEKSPDYKLIAATPLLEFEPGRLYTIQGGSIDGHCFVFVDGRLMVEVMDPDPIDSQRHTKVGFEAYASHIRIRNVRVRRIAWEPVEQRYAAEF